jgi:hypothetical protein
MPDEIRGCHNAPCLCLKCGDTGQFQGDQPAICIGDCCNCAAGEALKKKIGSKCCSECEDLESQMEPKVMTISVVRQNDMILAAFEDAGEADDFVEQCRKDWKENRPHSGPVPRFYCEDTNLYLIGS